MTDNRDQALMYAHKNKERFLGELEDFLRIPSISTDPEHKKDMQIAAEWVVNKLHTLGITNTQILPTGGHPVVFAEKMDAGDQAQTLLVYGHYDVQPPDPIDLWKSGPFSPEIRGDELYARGASDMKGQIMASFAAIESIVSSGQITVNLKFLIEGEEEIGSPNLTNFIKENVELLKCDVALNPDAGMIAEDVPTIVYGLRGLAYFEIKVFGPDHDLHSGIFGGVVHNPAQVLSDLISGMHDSEGRITLPGFYDRVRTLSEFEKEEITRLPMNDEYYLKQTGTSKLWGERGYSAAERVGSRPTLDVNGFLSGFTGHGSKTVIPAWAMAKVSMRLVPDQDPKEVHDQLETYLKQHAPSTVRWELITHAGGAASISDTKLPATLALAKGLKTVWGIDPVFKREGGSVPVVGEMQKLLGVDSVLTGFGLPDDNVHSPNEKLHLSVWYKGIDALIHFFYNLK